MIINSVAKFSILHLYNIYIYNYICILGGGAIFVRGYHHVHHIHNHDQVGEKHPVSRGTNKTLLTDSPKGQNAVLKNIDYYKQCVLFLQYNVCPWWQSTGGKNNVGCYLFWLPAFSELWPKYYIIISFDILNWVQKWQTMNNDQP